MILCDRDGVTAAVVRPFCSLSEVARPLARAFHAYPGAEPDPLWCCGTHTSTGTTKSTAL